MLKTLQVSATLLGNTNMACLYAFSSTVCVSRSVPRRGIKENSLDTGTASSQSIYSVNCCCVATLKFVFFHSAFYSVPLF